MYNDLAKALSQNPETFKAFRIYLMTYIIKDKDKVIALEKSDIRVYIPYCIAFIEYNNINMVEALEYYQREHMDVNFWNLLVMTITAVFRKIEKKDITFLPF